ncbi:MAG: hypothetical protein KAR03_00960 [Candidatus Thorarchaeota archaeon]|nr:hypothetical protein [Candidatus Thorarchaeota archaeon]
MRRDAILLIMILLLVVSATDEAAAPSDAVTREPLDFVLSQTEMPIYEMTIPTVNASYAQSLASSLFGISDVLAEEVEGIYVVNWGNNFLEVDSTDGSIWFANYDKLWNISLGVGATTPGECSVLADEWLAENGLFPANAFHTNIGNTSAIAYNIDSGESLSKILQYHVNYEFTIGEFPITGESAQVSVMMGEGGEIIGFDWKWRDIKPDVHTTATLIEYESILDVYQIPTSSVLEHRLAYTTVEGDGNNFLFPVYEISRVETDDEGNDVYYEGEYDATDYKPRVDIVSPQPSHSITVSPGQSITFDCEVEYGTPPYTYEWHSDYDGVLSTASTFSISTLSEPLKIDVVVPHAVTVVVCDSEGRRDSDVIAVTIDYPQINTGFNPVLLAAAAAFVIAISFVLVKRKGSRVLPLLIMLFSAFMLFPVISASSGLPSTNKMTYSPPTGAYDDNVREVGVEWIGLSHPNSPLYNNEENTEGFYNWMGTIGGYSQEFNWGEYSAWEEDFKDASFGGTDTVWIDAVDIAYLHSHGGPTSISFTAYERDQHFLNFTELRLGDGDLDTLAIDACKPLAWEDKHGNNVFERWGPALQGIHQVCSFATSSTNSANTGTGFGIYLTGYFTIPSLTIVNAWFRTCLETESSDKVSAVFYATKSTNPYQPQWDDPIHDHAYGFGYVCSDPTPGLYKNFVYITSSC